MRLRFSLAAALVVLALPALADVPLPVQLVEVEKRPLSFDLSLTGSIESRDSVDLGFRQGGRVTEVLVSAGDRVVTGQALARVDALQQEQALRVAEAAQASAQATQDQAAQAAERARAMLARGVGTRAARDAANEALSSAEGALERARTGVEQAQRAVEDAILTAPVDGVITARSVEPGQIMGAAQTALSVASLHPLEAVFQSPDRQHLDQAMGMPVNMTLLDMDGPGLRGQVTEISPLVGPQTGSVTIKVLIDEDAPRDAGMLGAAVLGQVQMPAGEGLAVPWSALAKTGDQPAVWVLDEQGGAQIAPIEVLRYTTGDIVIGAGVEPGQKVIAAGAQLIYPGRQVIDIAATATTMPEARP
ncbi:MAG: efflux RND transporter periplasmic adaptor subunit [Paracoccus sp. (in: a-proteobacteria)]|uniref:efflux RND transporter periplasmic adaptor subunit n=1 Tax=Paracoccus sp. TaxID=267 RepID=UPI0026E06BB6|nr:efflux RND transporter periplasmic adaptor subunit [Paracoccus sp. (in: a-proteobacteria)]MDO5620821.1 efflux RND transporter periplasmic adaptor subunit [Paracoccus sp. (in: a-proteobacteria)]